MKKHPRWIILAVVLIALGATAFWWLAPLLAFARLNSDLIQGLEALLAILLGLGGLASGFLGLRREPPPAPAPLPGESPPASQNILEVKEGISGGAVAVGNGNVINQTTVQAPDPRAATAPDALYQSYFSHLFGEVGILQLSGVDPKAASVGSASLNLSAVYTALLTQSPEESERLERAGAPGREFSRQSALEQLNRHPRLVLLGDPGSGKSTFVSFVALCLCGQALGRADANLDLLTSPLPKERDQREDPKPQPWDHGPLLPVRVVLRYFAAYGLPPAGQRSTAGHLWKFIAEELEKCGLGEFAPLLQKHLRERGGLLLVDGLDEVPEAEQRRVQIKQAVEDFAGAYPKVRILVTSRTYAYQKQDWQLAGFQAAVLAPFNRGQIERFVARWYDHMAVVRGVDPRDAQGRAAQLRQAIFASNQLMGLAERPLLLTLMASLHAWRGGALPEKREELYADSVDLLLDWWERPKEVREQDGKPAVRHPSLAEWLKVDRDKVRDLLNELAYQAHAAQPDRAGTADVPQAALVDGLMRLANNPDVKFARLVEFLRDRAGLLLPRAEGVFTFPHRTFQEYLAACHLTKYVEPDQIAALFCQDRERWREVLLLAAAKATKGMALGFWALIEELCPADAPQAPCDDSAQLWGAHLAAQMLVEKAGLERDSKRNRLKAQRVRGWLPQVMRDGRLPARERALAGGNLARLGDERPEIITAAGMPFCYVPAGPFLMGSGPDESNDDEKPQHEVDLPGFWVARFPVTQAQFGAFVEAGGYSRSGYWKAAIQDKFWTEEGFQGRYDNRPRKAPLSLGDPYMLSNHPAVGVSWYEARAFAGWLEELARSSGWVPPDWRIDLPSEAQWEKSARGGARFPAQARIRALAELDLSAGEITGEVENPPRSYPWGGSFAADLANTAETGIGATSPVGCFPGGAGPYGAEDLAGNVWEWCADWYAENYYKKSPRQNPPGPSKGDMRVLRGGSWFSDGRDARCAYRYGDLPSSGDGLVGFRVVVLPSSTLSSENSDPLKL